MDASSDFSREAIDSPANSSAPETPTPLPPTVRGTGHKTFAAMLGDEVLDSQNGPYELEDLKQATYRHRRFIREENLTCLGAQHRSRPRRSSIKKYGIFLREVKDDGTALETYWLCNLCDARGIVKLFGTKATSSAKDHVRKDHPREFGSSASKRSVLDLQQEGSAKRPRFAPSANLARARDLAIWTIVTSNSPFTLFTNIFMQLMLQCFDLGLANTVSVGRTTLVENMKKLHIRKRDEVRKLLNEGIVSDSIHISFDSWTSPNNLAFVSVNCHFLSRAFEVQTILLGLKEHHGRHGGAELSQTILATLDEYGIRDRIGASVCDNASNNDTCVDYLYRLVLPGSTSSQRLTRRLRCYGHIINLVAKALISGQDDEAFDDEIADIVPAYQAELLARWRRNSPVSKLHNIVRFIRASPQRTQLMALISKQVLDGPDGLAADPRDKAIANLGLISNNATRWNSTYLMIERARLKRAHIEDFITHCEASPGDAPDAEDRLGSEDWLFLRELESILQPLYTLTIRCQGWAKNGRHGSIWEVMLSMEYLLKHLEDKRTEYRPFEVTLDERLVNSQPNRPQRRHRRPPTRYQDAQPPPGPEEPNEDALPGYALQDYTQMDPLLLDRDAEPDAPDTARRLFLSVSLNLAWKKLNDYYLRLGESQLYTSAVILHPSFKLKWLEERWTEPSMRPWVAEAKHQLRAYYNEFYPANPDPAAQQLPRRARRTDDGFSSFLAEGRTLAADEIDTYLQQPQHPDITINPIRWWRDERARFPRLSRMAFDILSIPAMAVEPERTFSLAKLVVSSQRHSMDSDTLHEIQCLKSWARHRVISLPSGISVDSQLDEDDDDF